MPNMMTAVPNIGGALCESSVIPFLVPRRKVWLSKLRLPVGIWTPIKYTNHKLNDISIGSAVYAQLSAELYTLQWASASRLKIAATHG